MSSQTPYHRLVGTWRIYLAPASEAKPNLDASPAGNWTDIGETDGEQIIRWSGALNQLTDNFHTGPVKHIRPEEAFEFEFSLAKLTLENLARVKGQATSDVTTTTSGALAVKRLPNKRGYIPTRYALLARGGAVEASNTMSPYGAWPAQLWVPIGVFDSEPELAFSKDGSPTPSTVYRAEEDDTQSTGNQFGYLEVQSS